MRACSRLILTIIVTLLSILGAHSIAVPLSPGFPAHELKYIMDHSNASMLLSSSKLHDKAQEVLKLGLEWHPKSVRVEKKFENGEYAKVQLTESPNNQGGMMLYTSGTTSRPVGTFYIDVKV
jgi:malonyl-CoA/methylmalonyl-CoA synthetase